MGLKDYLISDLLTFFGTDDFADTHNIDGIDMPAIIDADILKERPRGEIMVDGVYLGNVMLFVRLSDIGVRPVTDQRIRIDGELYYVVESSENNGLLEITLRANRA